MIRAIPFNIHTPPVDEFSQNLPPKKKKIKVPTLHPPQKLSDFSFPPQKKTNFSSNPSEKAAKIKGSGRINPSETTFLAPSEKLVNRGGGGGGGGVYIKWHGPHINAGERSSKTKNFFLSSNCDFKITPQKAHLAQRFAKINGRTTEICLCLYASGLHGHS